MIVSNKDITIQANRLINKNYDIEVERNVEFIRGYEFHGNASNPYDIRNKLVMDGKVLVGSPWDKGDVFVKGKVITYVGTGDNAKISAGGNINITANKVGNGVETKENVSIVSKNQKATSTNVGKNSVNLDKIDIDEKDGNYIISISKDSEFLKEAMKKQLANSNAAGGQIGNDVKIENIAVKYIVDKNTYLASSSTVSFDFEMQGMKISMEMDAKMSNINNVTDIVVPEEALNAKEIPHQ